MSIIQMHSINRQFWKNIMTVFVSKQYNAWYLVGSQ